MEIEPRLTDTLSNDQAVPALGELEACEVQSAVVLVTNITDCGADEIGQIDGLNDWLGAEICAPQDLLSMAKR
jgi:hypothetical protein